MPDRPTARSPWEVPDPPPKLPSLLRELETPKELQHAIDAYCRRHGYAKRDWARVEEELKLRYYFGGQSVVAVNTADGLHILAAGDPNSEEFQAAQKKPDALIFFPDRLDEPGAEVLTPLLDD